MPITMNIESSHNLNYDTTLTFKLDSRFALSRCLALSICYPLTHTSTATLASRQTTTCITGLSKVLTGVLLNVSCSVTI
ncbi:hypothetical protein BC629DRAFT_1517239 [Irpex lacteus]|nr:hypothetical protein BC629DRAFT_1517239 [Irpex lacteus]